MSKTVPEIHPKYFAKAVHKADRGRQWCGGRKRQQKEYVEIAEHAYEIIEESEFTGITLVLERCTVCEELFLCSND